MLECEKEGQKVRNKGGVRAEKYFLPTYYLPCFVIVLSYVISFNPHRLQIDIDLTAETEEGSESTSTRHLMPCSFHYSLT